MEKTWPKSAKKFRFKLPIRARIVALLSFSLVLGLATTLWFATTLMIEDKTSTIFEYSHSQARLVSQMLREQTLAIRTLGQWMYANRAGLKNPNTDSSAVINQKTASAAISTISLIEYQKGSAKRLFGQGQYLKELESVGVSYLLRDAYREKTDLRIIPNIESIKSGAHEYYITIRVGQTDQHDYWMISSFRLPKEFLVAPGNTQDFRYLLWIPSETTDLSLSPGIWLNPGLIKEIAQDDLNSGVKELRMGSVDFLVGYERLFKGAMVVLSVIPTEAAFLASRVLVLRSSFWGFGILLIMIGLSMLLSKSITTRIGQLFQATRRVSQGDFTTQVTLEGGSEDEVTGLANSFNTMSQKISELVAATADKARMEKELETAQALQFGFFPKERYTHREMTVSGACLPASECGGDWWNYDELHSHLLVVVGDVTGHGVSSALITASVHSTYKMNVHRSKQNPKFNPEDFLRRLANDIHQTLLHSASDQVSLTFSAMLIHQETGAYWLCNAGHPMPLFLSSKGKAKVIPAKQSSNPLGQGDEAVVSMEQGTFGSDEALFMYSDGLFDARISDSVKFKKKDFLKLVESMKTSLGQQVSLEGSDHFAEETKKSIYAFFTEDATNRPDDITFVWVVKRAKDQASQAA